MAYDMELALEKGDNYLNAYIGKRCFKNVYDQTIVVYATRRHNIPAPPTVISVGLNIQVSVMDLFVLLCILNLRMRLCSVAH